MKNIISLIILSAYMKCPLCKEKFRVRISLRNHIEKYHTLDEGMNYLKRKRIKF